MRLAATHVLDLSESVCECAHSLGLPHAHVAYAISRMTQERVLTLSRGYVCEFSRLSSINFNALPPSSIAASADRKMLPLLHGPLALFHRLVLVAPESHTRDEPLPYSNSLTAAMTFAVPDLRSEVTRSVLCIAKKVGGDSARVSGSGACAAAALTHHVTPVCSRCHSRGRLVRSRHI